jgi:diaminopimelate epimerase
VGGRDYPGTAGSVGNPHLVCPVPDATALSTVDFFAPLVVDAAVFPESANVEFVAPGSDPLDVLMRVYERGSGETLSCGSGACVVAAVMLRDAGLAAGTVTVHVPGGVLRVTLAPQSCALAGPAVLVAEGSFFDLTRLI